jgi:hypothetical protein
MRILEGKIPEKQTWRVCVMLSPDMLLGKMWQLGSLLAKANNGELIAVVMVKDESEAQMKAGSRDGRAYRTPAAGQAKIIHRYCFSPRL